MILCPCCGTQIQFKSSCINCRFEPERIDGFLAWAPDLAKFNDGFPKESFGNLARVEANNFWFHSRSALIIWALGKYFSDFKSLLEVGCGTGFVLEGIGKEFPNVRIVGCEIYTAGLAFAAQRLPKVELVQMDARKLPFDSEFDMLVAFDVIEHIWEDELVLENFHRAIKPGGGCLITVPQHNWLWSPVDEAACHKRRYSAAELHAKVEAAGFHIVRSTSFVALLLPLMLVSRYIAKIFGKSSGAAEMALNPFSNYVLKSIMRIEYFLIKLGLSLPIGGSRLIVIQRKEFI